MPKTAPYPRKKSRATSAAFLAFEKRSTGMVPVMNETRPPAPVWIVTLRPSARRRPAADLLDGAPAADVAVTVTPASNVIDRTIPIAERRIALMDSPNPSRRRHALSGLRRQRGGDTSNGLRRKP